MTEYEVYICDAMNIPPHIVTGGRRKRTWRLRRRYRLTRRRIRRHLGESE